ncbi:M56 family metallopeptidase [Gelidibacter maritimus]|uniref:M56 family metallopeptidase n=1 Tax=Gelidibacter maritimus TaxID=2761487 RepID=A0A7W2M5T6_9FLAO|nr:M56 family metallopeptidase [Gelidibacter maritimus]MBA6153182.1 M56 family metallopeptidase [Gelidibacter maritimus]
MLIYLLKSGACLAIFMIFYKFFLEKENMHVFKRFYLLGALIIAFAIPMITFTQYIEVSATPMVNETFEPVAFYTESVPQIEQTNYLPIILWSIYASGVLVFGLLFIKNLIQIIFKIKRNPKQKSKQVIHVLLNDLITPHTFFKYIFLNKQKFEKHEIPQEVFWHEEAHAKQKHSIDVLFIELLQVIFWFNPLIYFAKHAIKMNHEFLADQAVLDRGISTPTYQHILLAFSSPDCYRDASESPLANAINYSSTRHVAGVIKKRFTVMKTHTTKRKIWLRSLVLLPLIALTLYGFSEKKEVVKLSTTQNLSSDTIQDILIYIDENNAISLNGNPVKIEDLETEINNLNPHLSQELKHIFLDATIQYVDSKNTEIVGKIQSILVQADVYSNSTSNINTLSESGKSEKADKNQYSGKTPEEAMSLYENQILALWPLEELSSPWKDGIELNKESKIEQIHVTSELIDEYNIIAKSINSTPEEKRSVKMKNLNQMMFIYNAMSKEQRQASEPFPKFGPFQVIESNQQKATPEEVSEYNKLAKYYNEQSDYSYVLKQKDMKRVIEIYNKMDASQKANAEPLPNFPPPPPPAAPNPKSKTIQTLPPPPPPPHVKLTAEQKKLYMEALNNSTAGQTYTYKRKSKDGKDGHVVFISDRDEIDSPSKAALNHIADMKIKGALFFYNDKAISAEEAMEYVKTVRELYISTEHIDSKQPKVYISTTPIPSQD